MRCQKRHSLQGNLDAAFMGLTAMVKALLVNSLSDILGAVGPNGVGASNQLLACLSHSGQVVSLLVQLVTGSLAGGCLWEQVEGLSWACMLRYGFQ